MFGLQTIDIGLGLVFVYFVLSVICSGVNEMIAGFLRLRAANLVQGIENMLKDQGIPNLEKAFYDHPLIKSLYKKEDLPSYIPSKTFALALIDLIAPAKAGTSSRVSDIRGAIDKMDAASPIRRTLLILLEEAENDVQELQKSLETWFNDAMDRVSGWYKRRAQLFIFIIAAFLVGLSNADTLQIVKTLSHDPAVLQELIKRAEALPKQSGSQLSTPASPNPTSAPAISDVKGSSPPTQGKEGETAKPVSLTPKEAMKELQGVQTAGIPLGWRAAPQGGEGWVNKIIGLLLSIFAVSLGAPFWFDVLNKIVSIRSVGAPPKEKREQEVKVTKT
jgi:hypothetical protein